MTRHEVTIRPARPSDAAALGRLGAELARLHHAWDRERFFVVDDMEEGYARWLGQELASPGAVVLAAARGRRVVGYAYGRLEPRDWNALRDRCGLAIDLMVEPAERCAGLGRRLTEALLAALVAIGAPRVVLQAAARNRSAQRLFRAMGFRPTMLEMTREAPPAVSRARAPRAPRGHAPRGGHAPGVRLPRIARAGARRRRS